MSSPPRILKSELTELLSRENQATQESNLSAVGMQQSALSRLGRSNTTEGGRIYELQQQVNDLLRYKEESFNRKADISILEEKLRIRGQENGKIQESIQTILKQNDDVQASLHHRCTRFEKDNITMRKAYEDKIQDLESHIAALLEDAQRHVATNTSLQQQLLSYERAAGLSKTLLGEKESELRSRNGSFQQEITSVSKQLQEITSLNKEKETKIALLEKEISRRDEIITELRSTTEMLHNFKSEQGSVIQQLNTTVSHLNDNLTQLEKENETIPSLRNQVLEISRFSRELDLTKKDASALISQLETERTNRELLQHDNVTLQSNITSLEQLIKELSSEVASVEILRGQVRQANSATEQIKLELKHEKDKLSLSNTEANRLREHNETLLVKVAQIGTEAECEFRSLGAVVDAITAGEHLDLVSLVESGLTHVHLSPLLLQAATDVRSNTITLCSEVTRLRKEARESQATVTNTAHEMTQLDRARETALQENELLYNRYEGTTKELREKTDAFNLLEAAMSVTKSELEHLKNTLESRNSSLQSSASKIIQIHGTESRKPDGESLSFETILFMINDFITSSVQHSDRELKKSKDLQQRNQDLETSLSTARNTLTESHEDMRRTVALSEDQKRAEIERVTRELSVKYTSDRDQLFMKIQGMEQTISRSRIDNSDMSLDLTSHKSELQLARQQIGVLTQSVESVSIKNSDLQRQNSKEKVVIEDLQRRLVITDNQLNETTQRLSLLQDSQDDYNKKTSEIEMLQREVSTKDRELQLVTNTASQQQQSFEELQDNIKQSRHEIGKLTTINKEQSQSLIRCHKGLIVLTRVLSPLYESHSEVVFQRNALIAWSNALQNACRVYETQHFPTVKIIPKSMRKFASAVLATIRLKKLLLRRPKLLYLKTSRGDRIPIISTSPGIEPGLKLPYPPENSQITSSDYKTTTQEDVEGVFSLMEKILSERPVKYYSKGSLYQSMRESVSRVVRVVTPEVRAKQYVNSMMEQNIVLRKQAERSSMEVKQLQSSRNQDHRQVSQLSDSLHSRETLISIMEAKISNLEKRSSSFDLSETNNLKKRISDLSQQNELLSSNDLLLRREYTTLSSEHQQVRNALSSKIDDSHDYTNFLKNATHSILHDKDDSIRYASGVDSLTSESRNDAIKGTKPIFYYEPAPTKRVSPKRSRSPSLVDRIDLGLSDISIGGGGSRCGDNTIDVLSYISKMDERVEQTLRRSRAMEESPSLAAPSSVRSDHTLPVIYTEPPTPL